MQTFGVNLRSYPTSINMIMLCMGPCSCRGVCSSNMCTSSKHTYSPSNETMKILHLLDPLAKVNFPPFIDDFHLETKVTLDQDTFVFALVCSPHLSSSDPSNMVYKLLWDCFVPYDFVSDFNFFFEVCGHIARGHVPPLTSHFLFTSRLLMLEK